MRRKVTPRSGEAGESQRYGKGSTLCVMFDPEAPSFGWRLKRKICDKFLLAVGAC